MRAALAELGSGIWLLARAGRAIPAEIAGGNALARRRFDDAMLRQLWRPLPLLALLGALVGSIAGISAARLLGFYHAELAIEPPLARALLRDVAPLVIGLFGAGRVAVGLATRLGSMALAREIDALDALGHDPVRYTLAPELAGLIAAVPVTTVLAGLAAVLAAGAALAAQHASPFATFLHLIGPAAAARALAGGLLRTATYLLIAFLVGAIAGTRPARDPADIAANAGAAFTLALVGVFAMAALWTLLG